VLFIWFSGLLTHEFKVKLHGDKKKRNFFQRRRVNMLFDSIKKNRQ
jgi:hypothetical protein